ncbi:MAG: hypothetical protein ACR2O4_13760, partial [Hyphomicrobiaceae bacterium]
DRAEALNALRLEYQSDYQNEIQAARNLLARGVNLLRSGDGQIDLEDRVSFVALGQARKRFLDALGPALKPLLESYARELEREAASLGLDGQHKGDDPLMESLHEALRHLQRADTSAPQQQSQPAPAATGPTQTYQDRA